jgi:hypothetical protein
VLAVLSVEGFLYDIPGVAVAFVVGYFVLDVGFYGWDEGLAGPIAVFDCHAKDKL